jgi:MYXO-CTERM domain-containing protein
MMNRTKWMLAGFSLMSALFLSLPTPAAAQGEGECNTGFCGTPQQVGGGGCGCGCGCAILINRTDVGDTYSTSDDPDNDGFESDFDNCAFIQNRDQLDSDGDGVGDACDNAAQAANVDQSDVDGDGVGDVADSDVDGDGIANGIDNCDRIYNPTQGKTSGASALGDACNPDDDADGVPDREDRCPKIPGNVAPAGQSCDGDEDADGIADAIDNCPGISNNSQTDRQGDINANGVGDACDLDMDGDGILNNLDNAIRLPNPGQEDLDLDGVGDVADDRFCFVFDRAAFAQDKNACLDPQDAFKVGGRIVNSIPKAEIGSGSELSLLLFANRTNVPIKYSWTVTKAPEGSSAVVRAPVGKVATTVAADNAFQYAYATDGNNVTPTFVPDVEGQYELRVVAELVFADEAFQDGPRTASYTVGLAAGSGSSSSGGGCSSTGKSSVGAAMALVGLGALVMRRRRRA